jgi:hypothetical protein
MPTFRTTIRPAYTSFFGYLQGLSTGPIGNTEVHAPGAMLIFSAGLFFIARKRWNKKNA